MRVLGTQCSGKEVMPVTNLEELANYSGIMTHFMHKMRNASLLLVRVVLRIPADSSRTFQVL